MVAKTPPKHKFETFRRACSIKGAVVVEKAVRAVAKDHFGLNTQQDILDLIAAGGLEQLQHKNTAPLSYGHQKNIGKMIDAYEFKIGHKSGYIAFHLNFLDNWVVKSFHPPTFGENSAALTHNPFRHLLENKNK